MRVILICVNYNTYGELSKFLTQLSAQECANFNLEVIVVDNSSRKEELVRSKFEVLPWISWLEPESNLGYYGAISHAVDALDVLADCPDFLIASNVDIEFAGEDFFEKLTRIKEDAQVLAPAIRGKRTGAELNPYLKTRPAASKVKWTRAIFRYYYISVAYQVAYHIKSSLKRGGGGLIGKNAVPIYAPHGSFVIFRQAFFQNGGSLRHPCFLYAEEIFVAEQVRRSGGVVRFCPELKLVHEEHASTGWIKSREMARYQYQALCWSAQILASENELSK